MLGVRVRGGNEVREAGKKGGGDEPADRRGFRG